MIVTFTEQADTLFEVERGVHDGIQAFLGLPGERPIPLPPISDKKAWERFGITGLDIVVSEVEGYVESDFTCRYNVTVRMEMGR